MKKLVKALVAVFSIVFFVQLAAQNADETIQKDYEKLISQKKYLDAFNMLDKKDPKNENEQICLLKTDLCVNYFARSFDHRLFALVNLPADKSLDDIRSDEATLPTINFSPEETLLKLIEKNSANGKVHLALGDFYYEKLLNFQQSFDQTQQDALRTASVKHLTIAHENKVSSWKSYSVLGYFALEQGNYGQAFDLLQKSIELNGAQGINHYNFAYCCAMLEKYDLAMTHADIARNNYPYLPLKKDAAYLALKMSFVLKKKDESMRLAKAYFALEPDNTKIMRNIVQDYYVSGYPEDIPVLFDALQKEYSSNRMALANTYLYRALYLNQIKEKKKARADLARAKEIFSTKYKPEDEIMLFIAQTETELADK